MSISDEIVTLLGGAAGEVNNLGKPNRCDTARSLLDAGRQIGGGIGDGAAETGGLIAIGVIAEGRGDRPARNAGDGVRARRAGGRIGVIADVGFGEELAGRRIAEALDDRRGRGGARRRGQAVELVIVEALRDAGPGLGAALQIATRVIDIGEIGDGAAGAHLDPGEPAGGGVENMIGDDAIAGRLPLHPHLGADRRKAKPLFLSLPPRSLENDRQISLDTQLRQAHKTMQERLPVHVKEAVVKGSRTKPERPCNFRLPSTSKRLRR
jgi:hypothetical protein